MKNLTSLLLVGGAIGLLGGCAHLDQSAAQTGAGEPAKQAAEKSDGLVLAEAVDQSWPPAGCPDAAGIRAFVNNPANSGYIAYFGLYSGDNAPTQDGDIFWLGSAHGTNVQPPNSPINVFPSPQGQGYVIRWNINDTVQQGGKKGKEISKHYRWDYDAARDGAYAVNALALNTCETDQHGDVGSCEQPIFGTAAWKKDVQEGTLSEFCPPVILSEDPTSLYLYDKNNDSEVEVYEYSLALILTAGGSNKAGLRLIIDPRIKNGGVGNR